MGGRLDWMADASHIYLRLTTVQGLRHMQGARGIVQCEDTHDNYLKLVVIHITSHDTLIVT